MLGHAINSTYGCPLKKFPPIASAPYLALNKELMRSLTWPEILSKFASSMALWIAAGIPTVSAELHAARFAACKQCVLYKKYACTACSCVAYFKAKLRTETCSENLWPKQ